MKNKIEQNINVKIHYTKYIKIFDIKKSKLKTWIFNKEYVKKLYMYHFSISRRHCFHQRFTHGWMWVNRF